MKRKREREREKKEEEKVKRRKTNFILFLHAYDNIRTKKQKILVYDILTRKIKNEEILFYNWFYIFLPQKKKRDKLLKFLKNEEEVKHIIQFNNVELSVGNKKMKVYKVFIKEESKEYILKKIKNLKCQIFEANISRSIRFVTFYKLRFLERILINNNEIEKINKGNFKIPIYLLTTKSGKTQCIGFNINQDYKLISNNKVYVTQSNKIICCWDKYENIHNENDFNDASYPNCFILYLKDLCLNFLRIGDQFHEKKIKIQSDDYYYLKEYKYINEKGFYEKRFDIMINVFKKYFQQLLYVTKLLSIPIYMLLKIAHKTMIANMIFLSEKEEVYKNAKRNMICALLKKLGDYSSNPLIKIYDKNFIVAKENEKIMCLDYSSMYPSIMLMLFENNYQLNPYFIAIKKIYELKKNEIDNKLKQVYKIILNSIYGSFKSQFLICGNVKIASTICSEARNLLQKTIDFFKLKTKVIYCNNDSLVVLGEKKKILNLIKFWNKELLRGKYKYSSLKIDREGKKLFILNKQVRLWYTDKIEDDFKQIANYHDKLTCIGHIFNSITVPYIIRDWLKFLLYTVFEKSNNIKEFKTYFEEYSKKYLKLIKKERIKNLDELLIVTKNNVRKKQFESIDSNFKNNDLDLRLTINLFSSFDNKLISQDYGVAKDLIDNFENRDFQLDKRLLKRIKDINVLINKL